MEPYPEQALAYLKGEMNEEERNGFEEALDRSTGLRAELERSRALLEVLEAASEQAVASRVERQRQAALQQGASDLHLVLGREEAVAYVRVDGRLQELERYPQALHPAVADRWKALADCELAERRFPQERRFRSDWQGRDFDLKVATLPTILGERVTVGFFDRSGAAPGLDRLGLSPEREAAIRRLLGRPNGFVPVVGPAGSGRTRLLYAMLGELLPPSQHGANVMTIEDPVETVLEGASQTEVDRRGGLSFAAALRALFRGSDPDVVYLADLPDPETARLALEVAATGHLVLAQVTGSSALEGIQRLRDFGLSPRLIAPALAGAIGVRQASRICAACAVEDGPSPALLAALRLTAANGPFRQGSGCDRCRNSGYSGRLWLTEVLEGDERLAEGIAAQRAASTLWEEWFGRDGRSLRDDAIGQVRAGHLSAAEAARVLYSYPHVPPSE